jgi:hypothetical protein
MAKKIEVAELDSATSTNVKTTKLKVALEVESPSQRDHPRMAAKDLTRLQKISR